MSIYGKDLTAYSHVYETGRTHSDPPCSFVTTMYPSESHGSPYISSGYSNTSLSTPISYSSNGMRSVFKMATGSFPEFGVESPNLISFSPSKGLEHSKFHVQFTTSYDIFQRNMSRLFLTFGSHKSPTNAHRYNQRGSVYFYEISTNTPPFHITGWNQSFKVPVSMTMESEDSVVISKIFVGEFEYIDQTSLCNSSRNSNSGGHCSYAEISKKRKTPGELSDFSNNPQRKNSCHLQRSKRENENVNLQETFNDSSSPFPYIPVSNFYDPLVISHGGSSNGAFQGDSVLRPAQYGKLETGSVALPIIRAKSPPPESWASFSNHTSSLSQSPSITSNTTSRHPSISSISSPSLMANPPLFRTSTFQQSPNSADTPYVDQPNQNNACSSYPHKARLEIVGELSSMTQNWGDEEIDCRRRLVLFKRSQFGSTINTTFHPVRLEERPKDGICISCIYWEEKNDCFVTSVDTIYLLQKLVAAQFTVEEKNRIRRNLEGFRPLTVSKSRSESEEFFKVIMAFPTPKPRNIEKDVKVFRWTDLCSALKKVIGKYSASSPTAMPTTTPLLTPIKTCGYLIEGSSSHSYASDSNRASSPQSLSSSTTSASTLPSLVLSPQSHEKSISYPKPLSLPRGGLDDAVDKEVPLISDPTSEESWDYTVYRQANYRPLKSPWSIPPTTFSSQGKIILTILSLFSYYVLSKRAYLEFGKVADQHAVFFGIWVAICAVKIMVIFVLNTPFLLSLLVHIAIY